MTSQLTGRRRPRSFEVDRLMPRWLQTTTLTIICVIIAVPMMYIVFGSVNSDLGVASGQYFPSSFGLENYLKIWTTVNLSQGLVNSVVVAGATALVATIVSAAIAYVLVRFSFRGRTGILRALLAMQSIPGPLLLLPLFVVYSSANTYLGLTVVGTRWGLFVTYLTFAVPFSTWLLVSYMRGLPIELEEAARIDGASNLRIIYKVILPLSWPGLVVSAIFAFLLGWNDVLFASVLTNQDSQTAAVVLEAFGASQEGGALPLYGQLMAASLVCAVPVVLLYLIFQRYLVSGLTAGSGK